MATIRERVTLLLGVVRDAALYRPNNPRRQQADAEYQARRPGALARGRYRCIHCGWESKSNECHHQDGNHANNQDDNLGVVDNLCHGYHHVGQRASQNALAGDSMGDRTVIAAVPELSATDLNLLQRALGVALLDPHESAIAKRIASHLTGRVKPVQEAFETCEAGDFAAAMVRLDEPAYEARRTVIGPLRLLYHTDILRQEGRRFLTEFPSLPIKDWAKVARDAQEVRART